MIKPIDPKRCSCGASGKRDCPAVAGSICPTCCATKRGPDFGCPAECPHYPFGTKALDIWQRTDANATEKAIKRVLASASDKMAFRDRIEACARELSGDDDPDDNDLASASMMLINQAIYRDPDSNGLTVADKWEKADWEGLTNDERIIVDCRRRAFPTVVEFTKPLSERQFQFVDLFDPENTPCIALGINVTSTPRYTRSLTWVCHFPHFSQVGPVGLIIPADLSEELISAIRARAKKKAGLFSRGDPKKWLAENYMEAHRLVQELITARHNRMMESLDVNHCEAEYRLKVTPAAAEAKLKARNDFVSEEASQGRNAGMARFVWLRRGDSADAVSPLKESGLSLDASYDGAPALGNIIIKEGSLKLETFAKWKFNYAKPKIAAILGKDIEFVDEKITDMRTLLANKEFDNALDDSDAGYGGFADEADEPSRQAPMSEHTRKSLMAKHMEEHYRKTLDEPIPMLKNKTPRQAAKDSALRPLLLQWGKGLINQLDQQRVRGDDPGTDLRWLFEELGLTELL